MTDCVRVSVKAIVVVGGRILLAKHRDNALVQDRQALGEACRDRRRQRPGGNKSQPVAGRLDDPPAAAPEPGIDTDDSHHACHHQGLGEAENPTKAACEQTSNYRRLG